jgi:hypothetical protein
VQDRQKWPFTLRMARNYGFNRMLLLHAFVCGMVTRNVKCNFSNFYEDFIWLSN